MIDGGSLTWERKGAMNRGRSLTWEGVPEGVPDWKGSVPNPGVTKLRGVKKVKK